MVRVHALAHILWSRCAREALCSLLSRFVCARISHARSRPQEACISRMRKRVVETVLAAKIRAQLLSMLAIRHKLCADRLAFVICGCADACGRVPRARSLQ